MTTVKYRLPDKPNKTVAAFILCATGESNLLFVPSFDGKRLDSIIVAHNDTDTRVFEDMDANWFNVESEDMAEIGTNLQIRAKTGARGGGRTHNLRLRRPTLYPIELLARTLTPN